MLFECDLIPNLRARAGDRPAIVAAGQLRRVASRRLPSREHRCCTTRRVWVHSLPVRYADGFSPRVAHRHHR